MDYSAANGNLKRKAVVSNIFLDSFLAFLIVFFSLKLVFGFTQYLVIAMNDGTALIENFQVKLLLAPDFPETGFMVYAEIYGSVFIIAMLIFTLAIGLLRVSVSRFSFFRLILIWATVLSLHHTLGFMFTGAFTGQNYFYLFDALNLPFPLVIIFAIIAIVLFVVVLRSLFFDFMSVSPSMGINSGLRIKKRFYRHNFLLAGLAGYFFIFFLNAFLISWHEMVEAMALVIPMMTVGYKLEEDEYVELVNINEPRGRKLFPIGSVFIMAVGYFILKFIY